jgi:hypothetical protein
MRDHSSSRRADSMSNPSVGIDQRLRGRAFLEPELALGPAEEVEDGFLDLALELPIELPAADGPE